MHKVGFYRRYQGPSCLRQASCRAGGRRCGRRARRRTGHCSTKTKMTASAPIGAKNCNKHSKEIMTDRPTDKKAHTHVKLPKVLAIKHLKIRSLNQWKGRQNTNNFSKDK